MARARASRVWQHNEQADHGGGGGGGGDGARGEAGVLASGELDDASCSDRPEKTASTEASGESGVSKKWYRRHSSSFEAWRRGTARIQRRKSLTEHRVSGERVKMRRRMAWTASEMGRILARRSGSRRYWRNVSSCHVACFHGFRPQMRLMRMMPSDHTSFAAVLYLSLIHI